VRRSVTIVGTSGHLRRNAQAEGIPGCHIGVGPRTSQVIDYAEDENLVDNKAASLFRL